MHSGISRRRTWASVSVWVTCALLATTPVQGQVGIQRPVGMQGQVGMKLGLTASGYRATHTDDRVYLGEDYRPFLGYELDRLQDGEAYPRLGLQLGVFYTHPFAGSWALQPELHLAFRGVRWDQMELYGELYRLDVTYLQLPLLLRYAPAKNWRVRPRLLLGPYAAYRLGASRTLELWGASETKDLSNVNSVDYGLVLGIENDFTAWSRNALLEIRFEWGLANTMSQLEDTTDLFSDPGRVNVVGLSLIAGYRF